MKVVLLLSDYYISANIGLKAFLDSRHFERHGIEISGIVLADQFNLSPRSLKRTARYFKKLNFLLFVSQISINIWKQVKMKIAKYLFPKRKRTYYSVEELAQEHNIPFKMVNGINSKESRQFIKKHQPDLLVSCFLLEILKKSTLSLPSMGSINVHPGLIQQHRGTFSAFWSILEGRTVSGATVHYMTEGVDDGQVIMQKKCLIYPTDTVHSVNERTAKLGGKLLARSVIRIKKRRARSYQLKKLGQLFSSPNTAQIRQFYAKGKSLISLRELFNF